MHTFTATLEIIGINPYVTVPAAVLQQLLAAAGRNKGPVPIKGTVNDVPYVQTLVKYAGAWRLYINTTMLPASPKRVGERIRVAVAYDPADRSVAFHPRLAAALEANGAARAVFESLPPSRRKEIARYIAGLKSEASVEKNVERAIGFLLGKGRFVGRDKP
ncbi:MAG: DUF1905 domain-containing protein [Chitinophagaceae bacterium]|nr:MAG: DUF1905 domain-containing protein [Chitinophagaceae bacterium]